MVALPMSLLTTAAVAGFNLTTLISFEGGAGQAVDQAQWNIITNVNYNNEVQEYSTSTENLQLSGSGTLLIIPRKSATGQWTSGRIESKASYTPEEGKVTRFQSLLRFGDSPDSKQQSIWPAFWMLGDVQRTQDIDWPMCGELDIMERKNGEKLNHGTPHCGPGDAPCGAMSKTITLPDNDWHTYSLEVDRTNGDWKEQTLKWMMDDKEYNTRKGREFEEESIWKSVAHSPMYFILNVAVGGNWPGAPNDLTADGMANMLEVKYIGVYHST
ncbi:concanavalin A-like lectin/glucanase domain-containing protein [Parachaetomium inaequale]|uniref:Concanavalin A-like lectin/glucanase domain-containing protein n=1 Tax=Parachaetomium inaequale TaxID=2588326 RepID=A0AAN6P5Q8_9PEZI|nr:concanavalin A-like lectin/glucanase domain-containing protein [Parachaetomium inaequale]